MHNNLEMKATWAFEEQKEIHCGRSGVSQAVTRRGRGRDSWAGVRPHSAPRGLC